MLSTVVTSINDRWEQFGIAFAAPFRSANYSPTTSGFQATFADFHVERLPLTTKHLLIGSTATEILQSTKACSDGLVHDVQAKTLLVLVAYTFPAHQRPTALFSRYVVFVWTWLATSKEAAQTSIGFTAHHCRIYHLTKG